MSTDDSDTYHVYTRREALQGAGTGAAAAAFPLSHATSDDDEGFWSGWFSRDPDLVVTDADGNVISEDPTELRFDGSAVTAIEEVGHPDETIVRLTVDGGNGFWTETADGAVTPADGQPVRTETAQTNSVVNKRSRSGHFMHRGRDRHLNAAERPKEPVVGWYLDDAVISQYENRSVWQTKDVQPALAVPTGDIGTADHMTWEQVTELVEDLGFEINNHSKTHTNWSNLTNDEIVAEVYDSEQEFLKRGFNPTQFVYPGGNTAGDWGRGVASELYSLARGTKTSTVHDSADPLNIPAMGTDNRSLSTLKAHIDDAVANNSAAFFFAHDISDESVSQESTAETSTDKIKQLIDYARNNGAKVLPPTECLRYTAPANPVSGVNGVGIQKNGAGHLQLTGQNGNIANIKPDTGINYQGQYFQMNPSKTARWGLRDVAGVASPYQGDTLFHDGTGNLAKGFAWYDNTAWGSTGGATEAAGTGSAPTAANYAKGQLVENTSDNTIWWKRPSDGTMVQIA